MAKKKPLFLVGLGVAAISYIGCQNEAIGNPKRPPDASADAPSHDAAPDAAPDAGEADASETDGTADGAGPLREAQGGSR